MRIANIAMLLGLFMVVPASCADFEKDGIFCQDDCAADGDADSDTDSDADPGHQETETECNNPYGPLCQAKCLGAITACNTLFVAGDCWVWTSIDPQAGIFGTCELDHFNCPTGCAGYCGNWQLDGTCL